MTVALVESPEVAALATEIVRLAAVIEKDKRANPLAYYIANETPTEFHQHPARERWETGGNQSSKTHSCTAELARWLQHMRTIHGRLPNGEVVEIACHLPKEGKSLRVRYYALDFNKIREILLPKLLGFLPSELINRKRGRDGYNSDTHIFSVHNPRGGRDHEIHMATYDQDMHKAEGGEFDIIVYDEPPPKTLYDANKLRILALGGYVWGAMTPLQEEIPWDVSWVYHEIESKADHVKLAHWRINTLENERHLDPVAFKEVFGQMDEETKRVRMRGEHAFLSGLVYKQFSPAIHIVKPFDVMERVERGRGTLYRALDHGFNNPTACLWFYVEGEGLDTRAYLYREYLESGFLVSENCENILEASKGENVDCTFADAAMWKIDEQTGRSNADLYFDAGLPLIPSDRAISVERGQIQVAEWLKVHRDKVGRHWKQNAEVPRPRLLFFAGKTEQTVYALRNHTFQVNRSIRMGGARKEKPEERHKHIPDAIRYFITADPIGTPSEQLPPYQLDPHTGQIIPDRVAEDPRERMKQNELRAMGVIE